MCWLSCLGAICGMQGCISLQKSCIMLACIGILLTTSEFFYLLVSIIRGSQSFFSVLTIAWFLCEMIQWLALLLGSVKEDARLVKISFVLKLIGTITTMIGAVLFSAFGIVIIPDKGIAISIYLGLWLDLFLTSLGLHILTSIVIFRFHQELLQNYGNLENIDMA